MAVQPEIPYFDEVNEEKEDAYGESKHSGQSMAERSCAVCQFIQRDSIWRPTSDKEGIFRIIGLTWWMRDIWMDRSVSVQIYNAFLTC